MERIYISSWGNCWLSLDIFTSTEMFRHEHQYHFSSFMEAKKTLNDYVENKRRLFEVRTQDVSSIIEKGVL